VTFSQQVLITLIQTSSTALLVAILGGIVGTSWSHRRERRREGFEVRTRLLNDTARVGQGMYVFLQHTRRLLIQANDADERAVALVALDQRFLDFQQEAAALQTVLGARFGVVRAIQAGRTTLLPPFLRWHQIHDLLVLYYYNLKEFFPGIVIAETSHGYNGNYHSGLDMSRYSDKVERGVEGMRNMRIEIRCAYDEAMLDLARGIAGEHIKLA
jgi:hypothetical protein